MYVFLTIIIVLILLILFGLANMGVIALFSSELDEEKKDGCSIFGFVVIVLVILLLIVYGLRSCA